MIIFWATTGPRMQGRLIIWWQAGAAAAAAAESKRERGPFFANVGSLGQRGV